MGDHLQSFILDAQGLARCPCCGKKVCIPCTAREGHPVTHHPSTFARKNHATAHLGLKEEA